MPEWLLFTLVFAVGVLVGAALRHFNQDE